MGAGQRLFAARAMESVTIDDIVAEADVAKGSFYNHFNDKEGLANAIVECVHGDCEFRILTANRTIDDPAEKLIRALCVMIAYAAEHPDRLKALMSLSERRRAVDSPLNAGVAADIAAGLARRRFAGVTLETGLVIATALIGAAVSAPAASPPMIGAALLRALGVPESDAGALAAAAVNDLLLENRR